MDWLQGDHKDRFDEEVAIFLCVGLAGDVREVLAVMEGEIESEGVLMVHYVCSGSFRGTVDEVAYIQGVVKVRKMQVRGC